MDNFDTRLNGGPALGLLRWVGQGDQRIGHVATVPIGLLECPYD